MNEKRLLNAIEEDAKKECDAVIEDAQKEAEAIVKDAAEKAERLKASEIEKQKASIEYERIGKMANARLCANEILLKERQFAVKKILEDVSKRFKEISHEDRYPQILKNLFYEAVEGWCKTMGDEKATAVVKKENISILKDLALDGNKLDIIPDETDNIGAGVIIMSRDKRRRIIINTLESRLEKAMPEIISIIDRTLFGKR